MIKITHTKTHTDEKAFRVSAFGSVVPKDVLVTEARLVLIHIEHEIPLLNQLSLVNFKDGSSGIFIADEAIVRPSQYSNIVHRYLIKPIWISEIEEFQDGDFGYHEDQKIICKITNAKYAKADGFKKIVALPEHSSPDHLRMMVDGKLKDGDEGLIECEVLRVGETKFDAGMIGDIQVKLNPHITIYNVEKKIYTRQEVKEIAVKYGYYLSNIEGDPLVMVNSWFEKNVK